MNYKKYRKWCYITIGITLAAWIAALVLSEKIFPDSPVGVMIGGGIGGLGSSLAWRFDRKGVSEKDCRRITNEEKDERLRAIERRAGYITLWVTLVLLMGMMWWLAATEQDIACCVIGGISMVSIICYLVFFSIFKKKM